MSVADNENLIGKSGVGKSVRDRDRTLTFTQMIELFKENWETIRDMQWEAVSQKTEGTYHTMKDMDEIQKVCKIDWSDNIAEYLKKYRENAKQ